MGVQLLDNEHVKKLDNIRENHKEVEMCCSDMFQAWLDTSPSANWNEFLYALKIVGLSELATKIEAKLITCKYLKLICIRINYQLSLLYIIAIHYLYVSV